MPSTTDRSTHPPEDASAALADEPEPVWDGILDDDPEPPRVELVRWVQAWDLDPPGPGDDAWEDYLAALPAETERLRQLFDAAPAAGAPQYSNGHEQPDVPPLPVDPERIRRLMDGPGRDVAQAGTFLLRDFPPVRWRVHEMLPAEGFAAIVGTDKEGKSLLALQLALCIAAGELVLGRVTAQGTVLLIEEEGSAQAFQERLQTQAASLGLLSRLDRLPLHVSIRQRWRMDTDAEVAEIEQAADSVGADVVLVGPLSQLAGIDENANRDMNAVTRRLLDMLSRRGGLLVLSHHRRKAGEDQPRTVREFFDSTRGGNALMAAVDAAIGVRRDPEATDGSIFVMLRDGPAQRIHIAFDVAQLLVHPTEAPSTDRAPLDAVLAIVTEAGEADRNVVAAKLGISPTTARDRLNVLEADGRIVGHDGPRRQRLYRPVSQQLTDTDGSTWVQPVSSHPFRGATGDGSVPSVTGGDG